MNSSLRAQTRPRRLELSLLLAIAFALRLAAMFALDSPSRADGNAWGWGWETACLAETLLDERPYGDTWGHGTGASGWLTPTYPALVALCMKLGGGVTPAAAIWLFVLHAAFSAATCWLIVALGRALALETVGRLAGWAFALYPASIWNAMTNVWDTTLVAFAITLLFLALLRAGPAPKVSRAAGLGALYGAVLMVNPAPLGLFPALLYYVTRRRAGPGGWALGSGAAFGALALVVCAPWMIRNQLVLGTPNLRSNLGVELRVGNNDLANGRHQTAYHPSHSPEQLARYVELGEVPFAATVQREAIQWIDDHRGRFARLVLRRIQIFWVGESPNVDPRTSGGKRAADDPNAWLKWIFHLASGSLGLIGLLAFRRGSAEGTLLRASLLLFPAPYYLTHVMERYRFPVDPLLVFLDAWVVWALWRRFRDR